MGSREAKTKKSERERKIGKGRGSERKARGNCVTREKIKESGKRGRGKEDKKRLGSEK